MNTKSLLFRISAWVIVSLLATTLIAFFCFYLITRRVLFLNTDNTLSAHAQKVADVATSREVGMHDAIAKEAFIGQFGEIPGMLVVVMDREGMVISSSQSVKMADPVFSDLFFQTKVTSQKFFTNATLGNLPMRFVSLPIMKDGVFLGTVLVAHPIDVINKSLDSLLTILGIVFTGFVVPVSVGGYFIVKRGLKPVSMMAEKIGLIGSEDLSQRVDAPRTGDELEDLATAFNGLLDRLNAAFGRERQFIGDVAHEIKTPLAVIRSNAEVALSKVRKPEEYRRVLAEVVSEADRLANTLKNVLDLAWSQSDTTGFSQERVNLSQIMNDMAEVADKMAYPKHMKLESNIEDDIFIYGKVDKISRAVLNLVDNAVKFTNPKGKVILGLTKDDQWVIIQIRDTGQGIAKNDLPHIFERFYRGSKTDRLLGSGLGLAIAKSVVAAHGGEIKVDSQVGKGSTFMIYLPLASS